MNKDDAYFAVRTICKPLALLYHAVYILASRFNHVMLASYYRSKFSKIGQRTKFYPECSSFRYEAISLGSNVFIGKGAFFRAELEVGDDVMFGPSVYITDGRHHYETVGKTIVSQGAAKKKKVRVEDDCWVGQGAFIGGGVTVGEGSIVGAMSVVTKDTPPYTINVGNPCRPISLRYDDEELVEHLRLRNRTEEEARRIVDVRRRMLADRIADRKS